MVGEEEEEQDQAWHPLSLISNYHSNLLTLVSWDRCGCACGCGSKYGYGYCIYNQFMDPLSQSTQTHSGLITCIENDQNNSENKSIVMRVVSADENILIITFTEDNFYLFPLFPFSHLFPLLDKSQEPGPLGVILGIF